MPPRATRLTEDVLIVGAGVIGLTTAICLVERGMRVRVLAADGPKDSASAAAGAIWDPLYARHPHVPLWAARTHDSLMRMVERGIPGVRLVAGVEASRSSIPIPEWRSQLPGFRECALAELPRGFASGWRYTAPIIDMPSYLRYLVDRLSAAEVAIELRRLSSLNQAETPIVINCSGFGARRLVPDPHLRPVRGQLVAVRNPGIMNFFIEQHDGLGESTYFLPQGDVLLLGGSAELDASDLVPDAAVARSIVARCAEIEPEIGTVDLLGHRVGIRPFRPQIRLEHIDLGDRHVIHNYGHAGSGVSLSWGCAVEVVDIVMDILR